MKKLATPADVSPFEAIRRVNEAGHEFWSRGYRIEDHFVKVTEMIEIGKGGQRAVKTLS